MNYANILIVYRKTKNCILMVSINGLKFNDPLTGKTSAKGFFTNTLLLKVGKNCKEQHQKSIDIDRPQQSKNCLAWHNLVRPCCFCWQPWLPQENFEVALTLGNNSRVQVAIQKMTARCS